MVGQILVWLLAAVIVLGVVLVAFGVIMASLSRWGLALRAAHVATVSSGITSVLGLALLVAMGLSARLGLGAGFFAGFVSGADPAEMTTHLGEFIASVMNGTFTAGGVALAGTVLWMIAHRRLGRLAAPGP